MPPAQTVTEAAPIYSHQQILRVVTGIMLCILLAALDQTVVIPAVPAIAAQLGAFGHLSWIVSAYLVTVTAATPLYGKLSDIYGRRALLLPALALFIAASVLCALSRTMPQLIAFRAVQGLGGAGLMAMAQAAVADVVVPRERGRYQGYMAGMWGVASVAGPVVGGWFTDHLSWTFVFWINVPLGLAAMALCNRALKLLPTPHRGRVRIDYAGAGLLTLGAVAFLLVLSWGGSEVPWLSPAILGLLAVSGASIGVLVWHERRVSDPILPPRLFQEPVFARGVVLAFLSSVSLLGASFLLPLFLQLIRGADASSSGLLVMPFLVFSVVGAFSGGQAARWLGRTKGLMVAGFAGTAAGFLALMTVGPHTPQAAVLAAMAVVGMGIGVCLPNVLVTVQNAAERRDVGTATAALLFLRSMGGAFGTTLAGTLLTSTFAVRLAQAGYPHVADLGAMQPGGVLAMLGPTAMDAARTALAGGFRMAFGACMAAALLALVLALGLRDIPLRSVAAASQEPAALGH